MFLLSIPKNGFDGICFVIISLVLRDWIRELYIIIINQMYSYSYNTPTPSISRLDELLNRNEVIYQNLKEKLEGINKSNQNIYRNINNINTNYNDPTSHQSSAIEREATVKHQRSSTREAEDSEFDRPTWLEKENLHLPRIDQRNQVTFSQENIQTLQHDQRVRNKLEILREEERLRRLESLLNRQEHEDAEMKKIEGIEEEDTLENRPIQRSSTSTSSMKGNQKFIAFQGESKSYRQIEPNRFKRQVCYEHIEKKTVVEPYRPVYRQVESKSQVKNNSIYLKQQKKISAGSTSQIEDEMPTFRDAYEISNDLVPKVEYEKQYNQIEMFQPRSTNQKKGFEVIETKTFINIKTSMTDPGTSTKDDKQPVNRQVQLKHLAIKDSENLQRKDKKSNNLYIAALNEKINRQQNVVSSADEKNNKLVESKQYEDYDFQNVMAKTSGRSNQTEYRQLNTKLRMKLQQIQQIPQCCLFAPFNKVYRSPILQIKSGAVTIERKSKTSALAVNNRNRIVDGIKYKFKNIVTDEQQLLKSLFSGEEQLNLNNPITNKVAIVGGRQSLKKKLHMGLIAYVYALLFNQIKKTSSHIRIKISHQELSQEQEKPIILDSVIEVEPDYKKISLMKLQKTIEDTYELIKRLGSSKNSYKRILRTTQIVCSTKGSPDWNFNIISSNRYDYEFLRYLKVNKICWAINPLVKYYEQVKDTLDSMRYYLQAKKSK